MNWRRAAIAVVCVVPVLLMFKSSMTRDPRVIVSPLPGKAAPGFSLSVFAPGQAQLARPLGDTIRLTDLKGRVVVLNFWASWCLACRDEHADLSAMARAYAGRPVTFVGALYQDTPSAGTQWIAQMGGQSYPSVLDPRSLTAIDYGLYGVPETFFISADGRIAHKIAGPADPRVIRFVVDSLLTAQGTP